MRKIDQNFPIVEHGGDTVDPRLIEDPEAVRRQGARQATAFNRMERFVSESFCRALLKESSAADDAEFRLPTGELASKLKEFAAGFAKIARAEGTSEEEVAAFEASVNEPQTSAEPDADDIAHVQDGILSQWTQAIYTARLKTPECPVSLGPDLWPAKDLSQLFGSDAIGMPTWSDCVSRSVQTVLRAELVPKLMAAFAESLKAEIDHGGGRFEVVPGQDVIERRGQEYVLLADPVES